MDAGVVADDAVPVGEENVVDVVLVVRDSIAEGLLADVPDTKALNDDAKPGVPETDANSVASGVDDPDTVSVSEGGPNKVELP